MIAKSFLMFKANKAVLIPEGVKINDVCIYVNVGRIFLGRLRRSNMVR